MSRLEIILFACITLSLIFNIGLFIYARNVVARLLFISEELGDLQDMIDSFTKHLRDVYEMEMFYGDETLRSLVQHAIAFNEQMETFEEIYSLTYSEESGIDNQERRSETEDNSEESI